jgi:hypothetical protein
MLEPIYIPDEDVPLDKHRIRISTHLIFETVKAFYAEHQLQEPELTLADSVKVFQYILRTDPKWTIEKLVDKYDAHVEKYHLSFLPHAQYWRAVYKAKAKKYWALSMWDFLII